MMFSRMKQYFSMEGQRQREQKRMYEFLSQAQDRVHLEYLEREWQKTNGKGWY